MRSQVVYERDAVAVAVPVSNAVTVAVPAPNGSCPITTIRQTHSSRSSVDARGKPNVREELPTERPHVVQIVDHVIGLDR
ncbi:hypothetical protein JCM18549_05580 [Halolamina salina]